MIKISWKNKDLKYVYGCNKLANIITNSSHYSSDISYLRNFIEVLFKWVK